jgi:hypothetical protein
VENNHILWSSYAGIRVEKSNVCTIRNNLIEWSGATGNGGYANINLLYENNVIRHNNWRRQEPGFDGGAGKWVFTYDSVFATTSRPTTSASGPWLDIVCGNNVFEGNICHDHIMQGGPFTEISWKTTSSTTSSTTPSRASDRRKLRVPGARQRAVEQRHRHLHAL